MSDESKYHTDLEVKDKVDEILKKCATLYSNLGTSTTFDVKDEQKAKQLEREWLDEIRELDPVLFERLVPNPKM